MIEPGLHASERTLGTERTHMQLVDDGLVPGPALPGIVAPFKLSWIDDLAGSVNILRIETGRRIGNFALAVDPVAVQRTRPCLVGDDLKEAGIVAGHGQHS